MTKAMRTGQSDDCAKTRAASGPSAATAVVPNAGALSPAEGGCLNFQPIGVVHSPYRQKFGIPRQPGLVPEARARLDLHPPYDQPSAVRGLEGYSHIWLLFLFHAAGAAPGWHPTVRPPRLGGRQRMGIFATRSIHRPNPIGMSAVRLDAVGCRKGSCWLELSGIDLLDGTPVLDIKPYLPWADALAEARAAMAPERPPRRLKVTFSPDAMARCREREAASQPGLEAMIRGMLALDPRPSYQARSPTPPAVKKRFGIRLLDLDLKWEVQGVEAFVTGLEPIPSAGIAPPGDRAAE